MLYWLSGIAVVAIYGFITLGGSTAGPDIQLSQQLLALDKPLKVVLFSYLPHTDKNDPKDTYTKYIQDKFDEQHPEYKGYVNFSLDAEKALYNSALLNNKLKSGDISIAEIDTIMLGEIVGNISPWKFSNQSQFYQVGLQAATIKSKQYGIPRLLCSNFLFTFDEDLSKAANYLEFKGNITNKKGLGYHLNDNYGISNYFDNYLASHLKANQATLQTQFDKLIVDASVVKDINSICVEGTYNQCLDTEMADDTESLKAGDRTAFVGYYETAS